MSEKLTAFERALLEQFETLEAAWGSALEASENTSGRLAEFGKNVKVAFDQLERKQTALEQRQAKLIAALDAQTKLTEQWATRSNELVRQVNALLQELRK